MRGIRFQPKTGKVEREALPLATLLLLIAGAFGILLLLQSPDGVDYAGWFVLPVTALFCWGLWYSYSHRKKLCYALILASLLLCGLVVFNWWELFLEQLLHVRRSLQGGTSRMQVTQLATLFAILLSLLLFAAECLVRSHALLYLGTTALLLFSPLLGIHANVGTVFLLVLFQLAFWAIRIASRRGKKALVAPARSRLAGKSAVAFGLLLLIVFFTAVPLVSALEDLFYNTAYTAESVVRENVRKLTHRASKPVTGGKISMGNNYRTGAEHLYLVANALPTETLYLRGFSGGEYLGGDWTQADDGELFEKIAEDPDWRWGYTAQGLSDLYYGLYRGSASFVGWEDAVDVPSSVYRSGRSGALYTSLGIQHCNNIYETAYEPYYSWRQVGAWDTNNRFDSTLAETNMGYTCAFLWTPFSLGWEGMDAYEDFWAAYKEQTLSAYTQVPTGLLPRLTALAKGTPLTELEEITAFILYTLHSNTTYTLSPGWASYNQDIAEYFLFERGKGFCEHYAATATLLYRLYGIPARYATGYLVSPDAFELQPDGSYYAVVTDKSAHAWVEIFLEDYGWTPIEVTPASDGSTIAPYPVLDTVRLYQIWREHGWDVNVPSLSRRSERDPSNPGQVGGSSFWPKQIDWGDPRYLLLLPVLCLCFTAVLLPLFLKQRRQRRLNTMERGGCRTVYFYLIEALHFGGKLPDCTGAEPEFAERLAACIPAVSREEAEGLVEAVTEAAYGPVPSDPARDAFVLSLYRKVADSVYAGLSRRGKIAFKWFKTLG